MRVPIAVLTGLVLLPASAGAQPIAIAWDASPDADVTGYTVFYGTSPITGSRPGEYGGSVDVGNVTTWTLIDAAPETTYYFRVAANVPSGLKSGLTNEVSHTNPPDPTAVRLSLNRTSLNIGVTAGTNGNRTSFQQVTVTITNAPAAWTVTADAPWVEITPASGAGSGTFGVSVKNGSYAAGTTLTATITVNAPSAQNTPKTLPVTLRVHAAGASPFGVLETPPANATDVTGAIPVTGWALDDVDVTRVRIYRDPAIGEAGLVFIGNATFVDGSRPDVALGYPTYPQNTRAGWGYMLLTNFLPNGGNGTIVLHAIAEDAEGHTASLGSKTITCDNAHATKPFGTIDTPEQGGTVSGSVYTNFGWVLTPMPNMIPTDGSTIMVFIDGVPVGRPVYNLPRSDISALFPGRANSNGAVGYYQFDTTQLANGVHTIAWSVSDDAGNAEGIGSRFFTVFNTNVTSSLTVDTSASIQAASGGGPEVLTTAATGDRLGRPADTLAAVPVSRVPIYARTGFDPGASLNLVDTDARGMPHVTAAEASRVEITLGSPVTGDRDRYEGYLVVNGRLHALPVGAFLDRKNGEFYWQPGAGFVGSYDLLFVRTAHVLRERIPVAVTITPRADAGRER